MSDIIVDGFLCSIILDRVGKSFAANTEDEKKAQIKKTNGIFELRVKNAAAQEGVWTIDLKQTGTVYKGEAKPKADVTLLFSDETFMKIAEGTLDGQKAFMTGKLKTKGNMMLATKLAGILQSAKGQAKL